MKDLLGNVVVKHTLTALGVGLAAFLADAAKITTNPWLQAGCLAGVLTLGALGIGYAKRQTP